MKSLIAGIIILLITSIWLCYTEENPPSALLYLAISLFLILKGYLKLMHDLVKKEENENKKTN